MKSLHDLDSLAVDSPLAKAVRDFCVADFTGPGTGRSEPGTGRSEPWPSIAPWRRLIEVGTELWLDTGDMDEALELWCTEFSALTTNNTLLNREVQKGIYDDLVPRAASVVDEHGNGLDDDHKILELAFILNAVHGLRLVQCFGTRVSVELHTDLAHDIEASVAYGRRYHAICSSHFIVKVPLTAAGLIAARRLSASGIDVNFTLGFSARQNLLIALAAQPVYCNVFMGRINAFIADRGLGDGKNAGERATQASQRMLYELRANNRAATLQIGASMRGPEQVPGLAGLDVYTMPTKVARGHLEQPEAATIENRMQAVMDVHFGDGIDGDKEKLNVFWTIADDTRRAIEAVAAEDVAHLDSNRIRAILADRGVGDLFPELDETARQRISDDGKIPAFESWRGDVQAGRMAWDSLLTLAGLASFATDQAALDQRIRRQLS